MSQQAYCDLDFGLAINPKSSSYFEKANNFPTTFGKLAFCTIALPNIVRLEALLQGVVTKFPNVRVKGACGNLSPVETFYLNATTIIALAVFL